MLDQLVTAPPADAYAATQRSIVRESLINARAELVTVQDHLAFTDPPLALDALLAMQGDVDRLARLLGISLAEPPGACDCCGGAVTLDGEVEVCPVCDAQPAASAAQ